MHAYSEAEEKTNTICKYTTDADKHHVRPTVSTTNRAQIPLKVITDTEQEFKN